MLEKDCGFHTPRVDIPDDISLLGDKLGQRGRALVLYDRARHALCYRRDFHSSLSAIFYSSVSTTYTVNYRAVS